MSLPPADPTRRLHHRRHLDVQVFARDDGLWEVEASLIDLRTQSVPLASGIRPAGQPIHEMVLRLVVDAGFNVVDAGSDTRWMPYEGLCDQHGDAYQQLIGLNLARGFRKAATERLQGTRGCTHLTELTQMLPTAVIQAFAGVVIDTRGDNATEPPFQIDRCHALRSDGEAVRLHYPRWYRGSIAAAGTPTPTEDRP